jgi:hypothetical protein
LLVAVAGGGEGRRAVALRVAFGLADLARRAVWLAAAAASAGFEPRAVVGLDVEPLVLGPVAFGPLVAFAADFEARVFGPVAFAVRPADRTAGTTCGGTTAVEPIPSIPAPIRAR